jgi:hypothetical protein
MTYLESDQILSFKECLKTILKSNHQRIKHTTILSALLVPFLKLIPSCQIIFLHTITTLSEIGRLQNLLELLIDVAGTLSLKAVEFMLNQLNKKLNNSKFEVYQNDLTTVKPVKDQPIFSYKSAIGNLEVK